MSIRGTRRASTISWPSTCRVYGFAHKSCQSCALAKTSRAPSADETRFLTPIEGAPMRQIPFLLASVALAIACTPAPPPAEDAAPGTHADLLKLFEEFRVFLEPEIVGGVPDYTAEAMEAQRQGLEDYKSRLAATDISEWTVSEQIDHHLVRAEMNGLDFHHRVTRPWSRDPAFYLMSQGGAGPAMSGFRSLFRREPPFDDSEHRGLPDDLAGCAEGLRAGQNQPDRAGARPRHDRDLGRPAGGPYLRRDRGAARRDPPGTRRRRRGRPRRRPRLRGVGRGEQAVMDRRRRHRQGELRLVAPQRPPLALRLGGEPDDRRAGVQTGSSPSWRSRNTGTATCRRSTSPTRPRSTPTSCTRRSSTSSSSCATARC